MKFTNTENIKGKLLSHRIKCECLSDDFNYYKWEKPVGGIPLKFVDIAVLICSVCGRICFFESSSVMEEN